MIVMKINELTCASELTPVELGNLLLQPAYSVRGFNFNNMLFRIPLSEKTVIRYGNNSVELSKKELESLIVEANSNEVTRAFNAGSVGKENKFELY